jgi:hypothetical protein
VLPRSHHIRHELVVNQYVVNQTFRKGVISEHHSAEYSSGAPVALRSSPIRDFQLVLHERFVYLFALTPLTLRDDRRLVGFANSAGVFSGIFW